MDDIELQIKAARVASLPKAGDTPLVARTREALKGSLYELDKQLGGYGAVLDDLEQLTQLEIDGEDLI